MRKYMTIQNAVKGAIVFGVIMSFVSFGLAAYVARNDAEQQRQITEVRVKLDTATRSKVSTNAALIEKNRKVDKEQSRRIAQLERRVRRLERLLAGNINIEGGTGGGTRSVSPTRGESSRGKGNNNKKTRQPNPPSPPPIVPECVVDVICLPNILPDLGLSRA